MAAEPSNSNERATAQSVDKDSTEPSTPSAARSKKAASAFRTISEVADELGVQQHVLRFWETKFSQVRPLKRGGGRRYYRPEDVTLLKRIYELLYEEGYTIKGVQKLLREQGKKAVMDGAIQQAIAGAQDSQSKAGLTREQKTMLKEALAELKDIRSLVSG